MVRPVGKVLVGVGVRELVLDDVGAGVDETRVRDDAELFDFARLKQNRVKSFCQNPDHNLLKNRRFLCYSNCNKPICN